MIIHFLIFRLPNDDERKETWMKAIKDNDCGKYPDLEDIPSFSYVCSKHFTSDMYFSLSSKRRLRKDAVPVLFEDYRFEVILYNFL